MIGLTENPAALRKFMLSGPALANMVVKFEEALFDDERLELNNNHHNASKAAQMYFLTHKKALKSVISELGNSFLEKSDDLYDLESKNIFSAQVKDTVTNIEERGVALYHTFATDRLESNKVSLMDPIRLNKYPLFKTSVRKVGNLSHKSQVASLKNDCGLFSRLYIATSANRPNDLAEFFCHENQEYPPSI